MASDPPDYAAHFEKAMADALAHLDSVRDQLERERLVVIDELAAAHEKRSEIERQAERLAAEDFQKHQKKLEERMRREIYDELIRRLLVFGIPDGIVQRWLGVSHEQLERLRKYVGPRAGEFGVVEIHQDGRGGTVEYTHGLTHFTLDWEFGGGDTLALIFVPPAAQWEARTGLAADRRAPVLDFIAGEIVRLQAPGHRWRVTENCIEIV